ncbi:MAG TPA: polysaccharide deacetylase family protein [Kofleriaceae bacterium]|nr:polysaccharide deacetylase family protein [Kofleriaceae bacterium]
MAAACLVAAGALAGCGDNQYRNPPYYAWDDLAAVGAFNIDKMSPDSRAMLHAVDSVRGSDDVVLFYGHDPPQMTHFDTIDALLTRAEQDGLATLTFADLAAGGSPRSGICLSFDDTEVDAWYEMRDLLARHHAHISLFVTEYARFTDEQRAKLHTLYVEGHSIEAHGIHHVHSLTYIAAHGVDALVTQEIQPSIDILRADGFTPVAYAHPYGEHTRELDEALAHRIRFARATSGRPKM